MARKKWILILTVFMAVAQQAGCVCDKKGEDACTKCTGSIRPKPKHPKRPELEIPPIGDNCWCSKTMIEPAALPKPTPKPNKPAPCKCPTHPFPTSYVASQVNYQHALAKDDSLPADPISISLAVQAGKAFEVPEAKLAYGFVRKPINNLPKLYISSIKEENLYSLANDVITLKKPLASKMKTPEEEYPEPEEEETAAEHYEPPSLTYRQLGYEEERFRNPEFVPMPAVNEPTGPLIEDKLELGCGFKPGRIANFENIRKVGPTPCSMRY